MPAAAGRRASPWGIPTVSLRIAFSVRDFVISPYNAPRCFQRLLIDYRMRHFFRCSFGSYMLQAIQCLLFANIIYIHARKL